MAAIEILTKEDLQQFKEQLRGDLKNLITAPRQQVKQWLKSAEVRKMLSIPPRYPPNAKNSPVGNTNDYTLDAGKILQDKTFNSALAISSSQFYKRTTAKALDDRAKFTLRRYYNRFCFRVTPFGLFSFITPLSWAEPKKGKALRQLDLFIQLDNHLDHLLQQGKLHSVKQKYVCNPTLYRVQQEYRFIILINLNH